MPLSRNLDCVNKFKEPCAPFFIAKRLKKGIFLEEASKKSFSLVTTTATTQRPLFNLKLFYDSKSLQRGY